MTDYRALAAEEVLAEYAGMTDAQKVTAIKAKRVTVFRNVACSAIYDYLLGTGEWGLIELFSRTMPTGTKLSAGGAAGSGSFTTTDQRAAVLVNFVRAIQTRSEVAASDGAVRTQFGTILDSLVTFNFISAGTRTALTAMASSQVSRAAQMGFPDLTIAELLAARKVVAGG